MSRIGKQPITVPAGVEVTIDGNTVTAKGPKGELTRSFPSLMTITREGDEIVVARPDDSREARSFHGLTRTLISNMVEGVSTGFSKKLQLVGVGYRAALKGSDLEMQLGFSHPVLVQAPENITFEVPSQTEIIVSGPSKEQVGQVAGEHPQVAQAGAVSRARASATKARSCAASSARPRRATSPVSDRRDYHEQASEKAGRAGSSPSPRSRQDLGYGRRPHGCA